MDATSEKVKIISSGAISAMLRRMAFEIYEHNFGVQQLVIAGIGARGAFLADRLEYHLSDISTLNLQRADFVKLEHGLAWKLPAVVGSMAGQSLLIVDDVLYSGQTILQALALATPMDAKKIQTAVLIDRGHNRFPIKGNYVGMEIATSLKQYVSVEVAADHQRAEAFIF
jgi:pyrimidine operon attenuation protein / uracil phosphoribosyltransferase